MVKGNEKKRPGRGRLQAVVALFLCSLVLVYAVPKWSLTIPVSAASTTIAEDQQRVKKLEAELAILKDNRASASGAYTDAITAYNDAVLDLEKARAAKEALDKEIMALEGEIDKSKELLDIYSQQSETYQTAVAEKTAEIDDRYGKFLERIRINYEDSFTSYLEIVLTSDSFADLLYRVDVVASLLDYDKRVLRALDQSKKELSTLQTEYDTLKYNEQETYSTLTQQLPVLEEKQSLSVELINRMDALFLEAKNNKEATAAAKAEADAQVKQLEKRIAAEEAAIAAKIKAAQEAERINNYVGGKLGWPTELKYNYISSYFVTRINPIYGHVERHNGIDIPCGYGTNIYAANSGKVIVSEYHYSYGNYVVIDHGGGISTLYAHNSKLLVKVGDTVTKGQVIAKAGSTGDSTGNHCHFMVRENGTAVNPLGYVVQP